MYRYPQNPFEINLTFEDGGIGDDIARLPMVKFIIETHPHIKINLFVKSYFKSFVKRSLKEGPRLTILTFEDVTDYHQKIPTKKFTGFPYTNLASHMTEQAFSVVCNTQPDNIEYLNYLPVNLKGISINRFNLPKKYVVVPTGFTSKVREFLPEVVNGICEYLVSKDYTPVFLGREKTLAGKGQSINGVFSEEINYDLGINLINQTNLLETTMIIRDAKTIVGLDNGLLHVAGTTQIPIVGGFTTVKPKHRMPYRHNVMGWEFYPVVLSKEDLKCNFCQSNFTFSFKFDFRACYYGDFKCCKLLTAEKYIKVLDKILI